MKIIFLHHAGGDQYAFKKFKNLIDQNGWEAVYFDLPGHGDRFTEPLIDDIHSIVEETYNSLHHHFVDDYAIFGTSMGTLIAYLLAHKLNDNQKTLPRHLFLASRRCPDSHLRFPRVAHLPEEDFWEKVRIYGGCPPALIKHKELREVYEPLLRADFRALEEYQPMKRNLLDIPTTILLGKQDLITFEEMTTWQNHFKPEIDILEFDGGHFFCYLHAEEVLKVMKNKLIGSY